MTSSDNTTVAITTTPKTTVIRAIRLVWQPYKEQADFYVIPDAGKKVRFHWMSEPRSGELDEAQTALKRLCDLLGIPFEHEEK